MPANFEDAFARVKELAADFKANENFFLSPQYQEAEARRDFIDKFLIALGWDVNHESQKNPYEQEVKVERKEHGVSQRRADYAFYIAPNFRDVKFYMEAKKPFGDIATMDNYFQTIRYGWSSQTSVAVLFDFEQFEIVDCRFKPDLETALQRNLKKFHYSQFSDKDKFAEIYWLFSREAVAGGSLEKYAESLPKKHGAVQRGLFKTSYQSFDETFLEELDQHRNTLAHVFKNGNPKLDGETLTELAQRTLDRLVFIRFLEDKLIEPQYLVAKFGERGSAWSDFIATSRRLDGIYNGIVFKKHDILDSPSFKVDDDQFGGICEALCHINSPYDFNAIPIHILGSIYERFLAKVIVATGKRARVEEKPEVRKAGGVYYTPEYIVRYIVDNTVGKQVEGKTPAQIAEMKFADIACGSGSFLLGVYDLLIRHCTKFYNDNPGKAKKADVVQREDGLHLSLQKKREILVKNVFGVDIDNQAVEVAQLSLYLKLLQDETPGSARSYQMEFHETLLPSLTKNIVCGNSLVGTDVLNEELFEPVEERKLNPMDFEDRFPEIMKRGGFDAIVGNPPYVRQETLGQKFKDYAKRHFSTFAGTADLYTYFIERAHGILKRTGLFSYIVSNKFMRASYGSSLRGYFATKTTLLQIIDFGELRVFDAIAYPCIVVTSNCAPNDANQVRTLNLRKKEELDNFTELARTATVLVSQKNFGSGAWLLESPAVLRFLKRLHRLGEPLRQYVGSRVSRGLTTGLNEAFVVDRTTRDRLVREHKSSSDVLKPFMRGKDIKRWCAEFGEQYIIKIESSENRIHPWSGKSEKEAEKVFAQTLPAIYSHFEGFRRKLIQRDDQGRYFWEQRSCTYWQEFEKPKIVSTKISIRPTFAFDSASHYLGNTSYFFPAKNAGYFLLGILNSSLFFAYAKNTFVEKQGGWFEVQPDGLEAFPIPTAPSTIQKSVEQLVEQMLSVQPQLACAQSDKDKDFYENKGAALNRQIDALVYELYGLTDNEIKIVEGGI